MQSTGIRSARLVRGQARGMGWANAMGMMSQLLSDNTSLTWEVMSPGVTTIQFSQDQSVQEF